MADSVDTTSANDKEIQRDIGAAAALQIDNTLKKGETTGLHSWGETLLATVDAIRPLPQASDAQVVQIMGKPAALVDWNSDYGNDPDKCVLFHCGIWATSFIDDVKMANADILATTLGTENTYGTVAGRNLSDRSVIHVSRQKTRPGEFVDDRLATFGRDSMKPAYVLPALQHEYDCRNLCFSHIISKFQNLVTSRSTGKNS